MAIAPESARASGANLLDRSRRFGADVQAVPHNSHALVLGAQAQELLGYMAWHRRSDACLAVTGESWSGESTLRVGDLDLLHGAAARAATTGWRRVVERVADGINPEIAARAKAVLVDLPLRSPFDLRDLVADGIRQVPVHALPGATVQPDALFASAALRNLPPPIAGAHPGAWVIGVRSAEELVHVLPHGWIPEIDQDLIDEAAQASPLIGRTDPQTLIRVDPATRAQIADLAMRAAAASQENRRVSSDAQLLFAGDEPGWVRLRAGMDRILGGHRPYRPWSTQVLTVTVGLDSESDARICLLLEDAIGEIARQRGSGRRFSIFLEAAVIRTPEIYSLVEDILRRGRKFNCGLVIGGPADHRICVDPAIRALAGCILSCQEDASLSLDHGSGEVETIGTFDPVLARSGHRFLTTGRLED